MEVITTCPTGWLIVVRVLRDRKKNPPRSIKATIFGTSLATAAALLRSEMTALSAESSRKSKAPPCPLLLRGDSLRGMNTRVAKKCARPGRTCTSTSFPSSGRTEIATAGFRMRKSNLSRLSTWTFQTALTLATICQSTTERDYASVRCLSARMASLFMTSKSLKNFLL